MPQKYFAISSVNTLSTRESQLTGPWEGSTLSTPALEPTGPTVTLPPDPSNTRLEVKEVAEGKEVLLLLEKEVEDVLLLLEK